MVTQLPNYHVTCSSMAHFHDVHRDTWTFDRMHRVVSQQNGTVLFYSLLKHSLLLWVMQPGVGLVRFYTGRSFKEITLRQQVKLCGSPQLWRVSGAEQECLLSKTKVGHDRVWSPIGWVTVK